MSGWRTALRIAARETRRSRGRSALVLAMIALPVLGMGFAATAYDMFTLTAEERLDRTLGQADASVRWFAGSPVTQDAVGRNWSAAGGYRTKPPTEDEILAVLPPGSSATQARDNWVELETATGRGQLRVLGLDLSDPLTTGMWTLVSGTAPRGEAEAVVTTQAAKRLGVTRGGEVIVGGGERRFTVTGIVEFPNSLTEIVAISPTALREITGETAEYHWLIDTPAPVDWEQVQQLNRHGLVVESRAVVLDPPDTAPPPADENGRFAAIGILIAGLGILEIVLLAGPAFAVGARRRSRELALVAAAGGNAAQLRRIVLADGVLLGLAGALAGLLLGVLTAFATRGLLEGFLFHQRAGGYRAFPLALAGIAVLAVLTGTAAALIPAFTAARQSVVAGLTGRRGAVRSRRRWILLGATLVVAGGALAGYGAQQVDIAGTLGGLILVQIGLAVCTPSLIGLIAKAGTVLPLAPRLALRDTARNRASAAPAVSAVMAAVAGAVLMGTYLDSERASSAAGYQPSAPLGTVMVVSPTAVLGDQKQRIRTAVADRAVSNTLTEIHMTACPAGIAEGPGRCYLVVSMPPEQICPNPSGRSTDELSQDEIRRLRADPRCNDAPRFYQSSISLQEVVDDGSALATLTGATGDDLAKAQRTLRTGGVVVDDARYLVDGQVTVQIHRPDEADPGSLTVPGHALTSGVGNQLTFFSPDVVEQAGLAIRHSGYAAGTADGLTQAEQDALTAAVLAVAPEIEVAVERGHTADQNNTSLILALAAGVIALGAAGIATGLTAADGRRDLSTLAAVGASPGVRRRLSLSQAGVIAGIGALLGAAVGLGSAFVILTALNSGQERVLLVSHPYPLVVPWSALGLLLVVPLIAMAGAGLLTRSRLPIERRFG
ncbi:ABC transporter permease [Micromonosporaceae bacterium DT55]|uniref:ABC transporter permease n=1 Tax=Melissospora conviva TaxID=3388432 RepID=UPI003C15CAA5